MRFTKSSASISQWTATCRGLYVGKRGHGDSLQFVFDGGILGPTEIARLRLPAEELVSTHSSPIEEALGMLRPRPRKRYPRALGRERLGRTV